MQTPHLLKQVNWSSIFGRKAGIFLLVLLVPNIVLLAGNIQLFPPIGWVDPGIYTGYFWDLPGRIARFGTNYFSMRLPLTLVGYSINSIFPPVMAAKIVAITFNSVAVVSIFLLVSRRMSTSAGIATAWAITLNPIWVATICRTYVDGPAMAYAIASMAVLLTTPQKNDNRIRFGISGALGAAAIYTHPLMVLPLGVIVAVDALVRRQELRSFFQGLIWIALGAALLTIFLGFISLLLGGKFLFILSDPWAFTRTFQGFGENYRYPLSTWVPDGYRLLPIGAIFALALAFLLLHKAKRSQIFAFSAIGMAATGSILLFLTFLDYGVGGATLQSSFYSSYALTGFVFIIAAAAFHSFGNTELQIGKIAIVGVAIALSTIWLFSFAEQIWGWSDAHTGFFWIFLTLAFVIAIFMLTHDQLLKSLSTTQPLPHQGKIRRVGFLLFTLTIIICGIANKDTRRIFIAQSGVDYETSFRSTVAVNTLVRQHLTTNERLFFWYDRDELANIDKIYGSYAIYQLRFKDTYFYLNYWDSLAATWLWDRSSLGWSLPVLQPAELQKLTAFHVPALVVTMCIDVRKCEEARVVLGKNKYVATTLERQWIASDGYTPFWVILYRADPPPQIDPASH